MPCQSRPGRAKAELAAIVREPRGSQSFEWPCWRLCFALGAVLAFSILLVRRHVPESPCWLMMHGHLREADGIVAHIEQTVMRDDHLDRLPDPGAPITIVPRGSVGFGEIAGVMVRRYLAERLSVLC